MSITDDIQAYLAEHPELEPAPDWQVAGILNTPSDDYPTTVDVLTSEVANYLAQCGCVRRIKDLRDHESLEVREMAEACCMVIEGRWTHCMCSRPEVYAAYTAKGNALMAMGLLTQDQRDHLVGMAHSTQSWAQHKGYGAVTSRDVGIARGARP